MASVAQWAAPSTVELRVAGAIPGWGGKQHRRAKHDLEVSSSARDVKSWAPCVEIAAFVKDLLGYPAVSLINRVAL